MSAFFLQSQTIELCDSAITIKGEATDYTYIEWIIDGVVVGTGETLQLNQTGTYIVTAIAYNGLCEAKAFGKIIVLPCKDCSIFFPNAVTPNGDGLNDTWIPLSLCPFTFEIYNRWGAMIYSGSKAWIADVQNDVYIAVIYQTKRHVTKVVVVR